MLGLYWDNGKKMETTVLYCYKRKGSPEFELLGLG